MVRKHFLIEVEVKVWLSLWLLAGAISLAAWPCTGAASASAARGMVRARLVAALLRTARRIARVAPAAIAEPEKVEWKPSGEPAWHR